MSGALPVLLSLSLLWPKVFFVLSAGSKAVAERLLGGEGVEADGVCRRTRDLMLMEYGDVVE
jgi:hypothetical protein